MRKGHNSIIYFSVYLGQPHSPGYSVSASILGNVLPSILGNVSLNVSEYEPECKHFRIRIF